MLNQTLTIALLNGCLQIVSFLLKLKRYIKERSDSCLTIIPVPTKGFWEKSGKYSMDVKRKHKLCIDMYIERYLNNLNPSFMK